MNDIDSQKSSVEVSDRERFWLWVMRRNKEPILEYRKKWKLFGFEIVFSWRSKKNAWGRFGGGWNWKVGIQIGASVVIVSLLVAELRINKCRP